MLLVRFLLSDFEDCCCIVVVVMDGIMLSWWRCLVH